MAKVVSPSLVVVVVVVVVVVLSLGGAPRPTQASDCNAADDIVVNAGQTQVIKTMDNVWYEGNLTAFVKPEREFKGVHLEGLGWAATPHTAWFPREDCFKYYDKWQMFHTSVAINTGRIFLGYMIGSCWRKCEINNDPRYLTRFSLVAHGSSRWRNETPSRDCLRSINEISHPSLVPTCQSSSRTTTHDNGGNRNPQTTTRTRATTTTTTPTTTIKVTTTTPTTTTTTTPTTTTKVTTPTPTTTTTPMILSVVAIVGLVGLLVAFVVRKVVSVVCPKQQQQQVTSNEVRFHPQPGHAHPGHAHPGHAHPQLTTTQGHTPAQDEDNIYYEILPGNIHRRVVFGQPPTHRDTHKEEEGGGGGEGGTHPARPDSPLYDDVLPNDDYGATEDSHSHIYATVL